MVPAYKSLFIIIPIACIMVPFLIAAYIRGEL